VDFSSLPIGVLCYEGKRVQLVHGAEVLVAESRGVDGEGALLLGSLGALGPAVLRVRFLGERLLAHGVLEQGVAASVCFRPSEAPRLANERGVPRVRVCASGTLYLRPPALGVPIEVIDLSIAGMAMRPTDAVVPGVGQRMMVALTLGDRQIKSVIEFVGLDADRWRGRFLLLGLSDEAAIASYVLRAQIRQRRLMPASEPELASSLDVGERLQYPLVEEIRFDNDSLTLVSERDHEQVPCPSVPPEARARLLDLARCLRLGDPADLFWLLDWLEVPEGVADSMLLAYWVLAARVAGMEASEVCGALPSVPEAQGDESVAIVHRGNSVSLQPDVARPKAALYGRERAGARVIARCCGLAVLTESTEESSGRVDPKRMLEQLDSSNRWLAPMDGPLHDAPALRALVRQIERWAATRRRALQH